MCLPVRVALAGSTEAERTRLYLARLDSACPFVCTVCSGFWHLQILFLAALCASGTGCGFNHTIAARVVARGTDVDLASQATL